MIQVSALSKSYNEGERRCEVLRDLDFSAEKGRSYAIIGESGSGKSTFLSLLAGLDHVDSGTLNILGYPLHSLAAAERAAFRKKHLSLVFQEFHLFEHLSAEENVALACEIAEIKNWKQRSRECLEQVGLAARSKHKPSQLSGGEKQRVALARAFATEPDLLIADEPTGNLDPHTAEEVMSLLWQLVLSQQMTLILVTHNHKLAEHCHHIHELREGKLHHHPHSSL